MERFSSQLYEKYINLKKRKFSEIEDSNKKRISDTLQYQSAIELLIEDLKTENEKLRVKIVSMQEQYQESQELLLKERQKTNELSSEVNSLKKTLAKKIDNLESASLRSPCGKPSIRLEDSNECLPMKNNLDTPSGQNPIQSENAAITLHEIDNENRLVFHDEPMIVSLQPDCCIRTKGNYGFKFTLSLMRDNDGRDEKLFYRVSSLGTIENIALEWMKDDMVFGLAMCPVFFDRLSRVVGHKC
ncbi:hypothetical protein KFK09_014863 [Dendrobium nobile]|uniref:DUF7806 domain-containing protein n=1 Tax=Dendrobium nobile TaxID=94219 RepID=A0A8T3B2Y3_DENNO|nr:hypothetical protein KFK09_014863 [Dendrobium nobile]